MKIRITRRAHNIGIGHATEHDRPPRPVRDQVSSPATIVRLFDEIRKRRPEAQIGLWIGERKVLDLDGAVLQLRGLIDGSAKEVTIDVEDRP